MCAYQEVQIRAHSMARSKGIVNERVIAEALSHRYCTCRKIAVIDLSRSEYNMPTSNKS